LTPFSDLQFDGVTKAGTDVVFHVMESSNRTKNAMFVALVGRGISHYEQYDLVLATFGIIGTKCHWLVAEMYEVIRKQCVETLSND